jgi:hypothetical protein
MYMEYQLANHSIYKFFINQDTDRIWEALIWLLTKTVCSAKRANYKEEMPCAYVKKQSKV